MKYEKLDDHLIKTHSYDYGSTNIRLYDFLAMETYIIGPKNEIGSSKSIAELGCLKGAKLAYEELIEKGGKPPEIIWPDNLDQPVDLSNQSFKPANRAKTTSFTSPGR